MVTEHGLWELAEDGNSMHVGASGNQEVVQVDDVLKRAFFAILK